MNNYENNILCSETFFQRQKHWQFSQMFFYSWGGMVKFMKLNCLKAILYIDISHELIK